jgi:hypothetical protein
VSCFSFAARFRHLLDFHFASEVLAQSSVLMPRSTHPAFWPTSEGRPSYRLCDPLLLARFESKLWPRCLPTARLDIRSFVSKGFGLRLVFFRRVSYAARSDRFCVQCRTSPPARSFLRVSVHPVYFPFLISPSAQVTAPALVSCPHRTRVVSVRVSADRSSAESVL